MIIVVIIWAILYLFVLPLARSSYSSFTTVTRDSLYKDIDEELALKYGIDLKEFKKMAYDKYVQIQQSWTNFDYDKLKDLLSDELYNSYRMQLETLKIKNQKNIMKDFKFYYAKVYRVVESSGIITVSVYLNISMYDYVVDSKGTTIRGNDRRKVNIGYVIDFTKDINSNSEVKICPNCGSEINMKVSGNCEYCRSKIIVKPTDYVMSRKTNISQKWL